MKRATLFCVPLLGALMVGGVFASPLDGQNAPIPFDDGLGVPPLEIAVSSAPSATATPSETVAPAAIETRLIANGKPAVMVMGFESGTVAAQAQKQGGLRGLFGGRNEAERYEPSQLGVGIADMLIEKLLETGQFRVMERKPLEPGSGAQFVVTGSVTKFGFEENNFGGIAANMVTMGLLSYNQHKTEVTLTARVINAATGEIVASMSAHGLSRKGGGLRVAGIGSHGFGGVDVNSSNFRATAIGEATERAVSKLAERILQLKTSF